MAFVDSVADAIKSAICLNLRASDASNEFFNELSPIDLPNFARYWRAKLCDIPFDDYTPPEANFQGGQCPGVRYRIFLERPDTTRSEYLEQFDIRGPISSISFSPPQWNSTGSQNFTVSASWEGGSGQDTEPFASLVGDVPRIVVTRFDGQPDTCGNPPGPTPPPWPPGGNTYNISVEYTDIDGDTVTEEGDFNLYAPVFIAGNVIAPITVDLGGVEFSGTVELSPEFNIELGSPDTEAPVFGDGPDTPPTPGPPDVPDTPSDADTRELLGAVVTATEAADTRTTQFPQGDGPTLYLPRVGSLYFRVAVPGGFAWTADVDIKHRRQFIPAPLGARAQTAIAFFDTGWEGTVTLIYRDSRPSG